MDDCLVCKSICSCIPDSLPHRMTSTKCRIDTVVSPDDGHIVARNKQRKEINALRKTVHQVGFIYKMKYTAADSTATYIHILFVHLSAFFSPPTKGPLTSPHSQRGPRNNIKLRTSTLLKLFQGLRRLLSSVRQ